MNSLLPTTARLDPELLLQILDLPVSLNEWFSKSQDEWDEETGLSRWEQVTARRLLREAGFLEEQRLGMPAKLWFRVCPERVWRALQARAALAPR